MSETKSEIRVALDGIWDQVAKDQYWNAIYRTAAILTPMLLRAFDRVLKGEAADV